MSTKSGSSSRQEPQRVGNYYVENEIGRGSFATVYKGYRSVRINLPSGSLMGPTGRYSLQSRRRTSPVPSRLSLARN